MMTICLNPKPLDFGTSDPSTFKVCTFLVNVLSYMYHQWKTAKFPKPDDFKWQPTNHCLVTSNFKVADYDFGPLIWSKFTYTDAGKQLEANEPFGSIVRAKADGSLYLVFRGSKSRADFLVDKETARVPYNPPTSDPPPGIQVAKGWYSVYQGLLTALRAQFEQQGVGGAQLTVTGHSLGSALATLAVPEAVALPWHCTVRHYNSASPMVGVDSFRSYYGSLTGSSPGSVKETYRLVNTADDVPKFPGFPYVHVGTQVSFNADYGDEEKPFVEKKTHNPCCSYAYAIYHPNAPCNPTFDACAVLP